MLKKIFLLFIVFCLNIVSVYAVQLKNPLKGKFKKKQPPQKVKMVETKQEWEIQAENVPVEQRKLNNYKAPQSTKKFYYPNPKYRFEQYNYPSGSKEINISEIKKKHTLFSPLVADMDCRFAAYTRFFYSIDIDQISSNFYVEKLDTSKIKTKRIADFNPLEKKEKPIIQSGTKEFYPHLFNGLTLVDWNRGSDKLLIKEKIGSTVNGLYHTYLHVYFLNQGYVLKLTDFEQAISDYFLDFENIQISRYRYELYPLGFSSENDSMVVAYFYMYDNENRRIFMGTWGYNCDTNETLLLSRDNSEYSISANGLLLKQVVD